MNKLIISGIVFASLVAFASPALAVVLSSSTNCEVTNDSGHLWLKHKVNGVVQYQARIGAGGAISEIRMAGNNWLAPPTGRGEVTDRIIHSVWFHENIAMPASVAGTAWNTDQRFNVNQAGNSDGSERRTTTLNPEGLAGISFVRVLRNTCQVQIVVSARKQFIAKFDPYMKMNRNLWIEYAMREGGEIWVRKIELVGGKSLHGGHVPSCKIKNECPNYDMNQFPSHKHTVWLEEWTPFRPGVVGQVALSLRAGGGVGEWINTANVAGVTTEKAYGSSSGYAVAMGNVTTGRSGVAIIYGMSRPLINGAAHDSWRGRLITYGKRGEAVALLCPQLLYNGTVNNGHPDVNERYAIPSGSMIDQMYYLWPKTGTTPLLTEAFRNRVETLRHQLIAPRLFFPANVPPDFGGVRSYLIDANNRSDSQLKRVERLGNIAVLVN